MAKTAIIPTLLLLALRWAIPANGETLAWIDQFGTSERDRSVDGGVAADPFGNVFVAGYTSGDFVGTNAGNADVILVKYTQEGTIDWTRQFGSSYFDTAGGIATDELGNVYVTGYTQGNLVGGAIPINSDAFLSKFDSSGSLQWIRQFGTSFNSERANRVSMDGVGNVYVSGSIGFPSDSVEYPTSGASDAFLTKFDGIGDHQWTRQFGTAETDYGYGLTIDGHGNAYVTGYTGGSLEGPNRGEQDVFLRKYDPEGEPLWTRQFGTTEGDQGRGVSADADGNIYVTGVSRGELGGVNAGEYDAFLTKSDTGGTLLWSRQFGSSGIDYAHDVSVDGLGGIFIAGYTTGDLVGINAGGVDSFVTKFDTQGSQLWSEQLGSTENEAGRGISADGMGSVYLSGYTKGSLQGASAGSDDVFLAKFSADTSPCDFDGDILCDIADLNGAPLVGPTRTRYAGDRPGGLRFDRRRCDR